MKARLSFGGSTPQNVDHQVPKDQESVDSNSQDNLLSDNPLEEYTAFPIGVFEDDEESLHFPEEEAPEVAEVQLRSGRQLPRPSPQQRNPPNVTPNDATDHTPNVSVKYDVISHLKKIPAMLSVYDALCLSSDLRNAFITALSFPEDYRVEVSQAEVKLSQT